MKGVDILLRAVAATRMPLHLLVVGEGPLRAKLASLSVRLGLKSRVRFVGEVPHARIPDYLRASNVVAFGSYAEGVPTALLEAIGCGRPVVATAVGGIPEVLVSELGLLAKPGDPDDLARALNEALERTWDEKRIAEVAKAYSWSRISGEWLRIYQEATMRGWQSASLRETRTR